MQRPSPIEAALVVEALPIVEAVGSDVTPVEVVTEETKSPTTDAVQILEKPAEQEISAVVMKVVVEPELKNIRIADIIDSGSNESGDEAKSDHEEDVEALQLEDESPVAKPQATKIETISAANNMIG